MRNPLYFILFCGLFSCASVFAQEVKQQHPWSIEPTIHFGQIFKHNSTIIFDPPASSIGVEVNFKWQTRGQRPWHQLQRYPQFGLSVLHYFLDQQEILGNATALIPNITLDILRREKFDVQFMFGNGVVYITYPYDPLTNSTNNAIGSTINSAVLFKLTAGYAVKPSLKIVLGGSFAHFSNGGAQLPNLGINIPAVTLGVQYKPHPISRQDFVRHNIQKRGGKRFGGSLHLNLAYREYIIEGGPRYPIYIATAAGHYYLNKVNRAWLGMTYEFNSGIYHFGLHTYDFGTLKDARIGSTRWMVFVGDEFLFGPWGILLQLGTYINRSAFLIPRNIYSKLGINFYFPPIGKPATKFYVSIFLKSHLAVAEYISFGVGANL